MGIVGLAPDPAAGRWRTLKGFLLTAGISLAVIGVFFSLLFLPNNLSIFNNDVVAGVYYITLFYAAPLGFVVGVIGSIIAGVRYALARRATGRA
jgi:hypothetical protein